MWFLERPVLFCHSQEQHLQGAALDLEDGDLVNEFTQRDGGKDVLDWLWLDCRPSRSVLRGS